MLYKLVLLGRVTSLALGGLAFVTFQAVALAHEAKSSAAKPQTIAKSSSAHTAVVAHLLPQTQQELARVRSATVKYDDVDAAIADGYADINVVLPGQGRHFLKESILDATFEIRQPEILVYAPDPRTKRLRLVAVEYAVPLKLSATAPEGFTGDSDKWMVAKEYGLWTLHVWPFMDNPNGVFAHSNTVAAK
jgi:hypothetical protein